MGPAESSAEFIARITEQIEANPAEAAEAVRQYLKSDPLNAEAYRVLAQALKAGGNGVKTSAAGTVGVPAGNLLHATKALDCGDLETAEIILRSWLRQRPHDDTALELLADFAVRLGYLDEAEQLLRLALDIAPHKIVRKIRLAGILYQRNQAEAAIALLDAVLVNDPSNRDALNLAAAANVRAGRFDRGLSLYEDSLRRSPIQAQIWSAYGQTLRSVGRKDESVAAIRRGIDLSPLSGQLWSSLADLKTHRLGAADAAKIRSALAQSQPASLDTINLHFALAKALEDGRDYAAAFDHYAEGNRLQKERVDYDPGDIGDYVDAVRRLIRSDFYAARSDWGDEARDPIFIVGMPRAGSTLLEQILGGHPQIEATMELPDLIELGEGFAPRLHELPDRLVHADRSDIDALGHDYAERTRRYRHTDRPLFIDKMPNNWLYLPLILLALPGAKILDMRRHPLDCGLSNFKQLFLSGQGFSNDLAWLGRYYRDYVSLIRHIDEVQPGRVHRVLYEQLVDDPEAEVRKILAFIGVDFDAACLRHYEGSRIVRTASADQVFEPIHRRGMGAWRAFEPWLAPLKDTLGSVLRDYPDVPTA